MVAIYGGRGAGWQVAPPQRFPCPYTKQIALRENYAGIFFIQAGLKLWKIYRKSAEPRGKYHCFLSPVLLARAALGGRVWCGVGVHRVLLDTDFMAGLASLQLFGLGSYKCYYKDNINPCLCLG